MSWYGEPGRHALARRGIKTTGSLVNRIALRRLVERVEVEYDPKRTWMVDVPVAPGYTEDFLSVGDPPFQIPEQGMYYRSPMEDSPVKKIPIKEIWTWQDRFNPAVVVWHTKSTSNFVRGLTPVEVIYDSTNDQYWVYDGNHRVIAAKLLGQQTIEAKVLMISGAKALSTLTPI